MPERECMTLRICDRQLIPFLGPQGRLDMYMDLLARIRFFPLHVILTFAWSRFTSDFHPLLRICAARRGVTILIFLGCELS